VNDTKTHQERRIGLGELAVETFQAQCEGSGPTSTPFATSRPPRGSGPGPMSSRWPAGLGTGTRPSPSGSTPTPSSSGTERPQRPSADSFDGPRRDEAEYRSRPVRTGSSGPDHRHRATRWRRRDRDRAARGNLTSDRLDRGAGDERDDVNRTPWAVGAPGAVPTWSRTPTSSTTGSPGETLVPTRSQTRPSIASVKRWGWRTDMISRGSAYGRPRQKRTVPLNALEFCT